IIGGKHFEPYLDLRMAERAEVMATNGRMQCSLISVPVKEGTGEGEPNNFQVKHKGPVPDVVQVANDALLDRGVAAPSIDLCPSGNATFRVVPAHVARNVLLKQVDKVRALGPRADRAHIPDQD